MNKLYIINGAMGGLSFDLKKDVISIGRSEENDIQITDRSISRNHAKLSRRGNRFFIEDLKSRNGTLIDGWSLKGGEKFEIKEGSHIAIGNTFMSLGEPHQMDGMITQYSMDLSATTAIRKRPPLYKDRRITNRKKLELIYEVSTLLMQSLDIREIFQKIMDSLFSCLERVDAGAIILIDHKNKKGKVIINRSREDKKDLKMNYSRTIVNRVIRDGQAIMMTDVREEGEYDLSASMDAMQIKSIMCVPLTSKSKIRGVIYLHSLSVTPGFQKEDLLLSTALSSPAALAIENALLYSNRKRVEKALRESEEKYRILVDNANDAVFVTQDEVIKFPNPKAQEMLGYSSQEFARIPFDHLIHPEDRYMILQSLKKKLHGEESPITHSFRILNKSGEELWVQLNVVPITWEGRPGTLNFLRDITQEKKMEAQLIQAQKMEAIGTLAGGIAHDFNNILSAIIGYAELTAFEIKEGTKARKNLDEVIRGGERARDLVQEILTFSRQNEHERKLVYIGAIVKEVLKLLRASLPSTVEIRQDIEKDIGLIEADPTHIHQLMMNLCTNAGHAMREKGGILEVSLSYIDIKPENPSLSTKENLAPYVRLTVGDTGHGMDKAVIKRIFDPYFTTKDQGEGTGLGLAVIHGIVKSHNGAITVQSKPGEGSTFNVYFPVIKDEAVPESDLGEEPLPTGQERILFIDDEPTLANLGKQLLEHLGYKVDTRTSSTEALELFREKADQFDLVITDMTMPRMTGEKLAKEIIKIQPEIPIVLCTGYSERITEDRAKKIGIVEFAMKPLLIHDLAKITRRALDKK